MQDHFIANFTHEIRTLISSIYACTDLLTDLVRGQPEAKELVETIRRSSDHLRKLINNALDLSKIEAGKLRIHKTRCDPGQIVAEVASLMRPTANEKGLQLHATSRGMIPQTIYTDPIRLRQILLNFTDNAIKFTRRGDVHLTVEMVRGDNPAPERIRFLVSDSGIGISEEHQQRIFTPFVQAEAYTDRCFGGTGLGLTICRQLAELIDGEITLNSRVNQGTTFALSLNTGALEGIASVEHIPQLVMGQVVKRKGPVVGGHQGRLGGLRVLVVESRPEIKLLVSVVLKNASADVCLADDVVGVINHQLSATQSGQLFDMVLIDMHMRETDGCEVASQLRQNGYEGPIVALTDDAGSTSAQQAWRDAGITECACVPTELDILIGDVARIVAQQRPEADA